STRSPLPALKGIGRRVTPFSSRDSEHLLSTLLRPLSAPRSLVVRIARAARGYPLRPRQVARALHREWGQGRTIRLQGLEIEIPHANRRHFAPRAPFPRAALPSPGALAPRP